MSERIEALLAAMTLEEKVGLLSGSDLWHAQGCERLEIPPLKVSDGPHGVRGGDLSGTVAAACFPCGTALGATWNPELVEAVGAAIGDEARTKNVHVVLGPTVNLHRAPLAGRNFECYAEDPHLSARLAVAFVRGVQGRGVGACVKHFVCNDSEFERHTMSSEVGERPLRELYLAPFEAAVREADPWSVMTAYNRVNGVYACDHPLLADVLRGEWGFRGFVVSDWFGMQSTEASLLAGNDLEMPGPGRFRREKLVDAVKAGRVDAKDVDACARRMLEARERAGILTGPVSDAEEAVDRPEHRAVARRAAAEGMVLLRNPEGLLPLDAGALRRVAVIGPNAARPVVIGGGSSQVTPHYGVSPLDGIRAHVERHGGEVVYRPGCTNHESLPVLRGDFELAFYPNFACEGEPVRVQRVSRVDFTWLGRFVPEIDPARFSARLRGRFEPRTPGPWTFGLSSAGKARLLVDDHEVIDNWTHQEKGTSFYGAGSAEKAAQVELTGPVTLTLEYSKEDASPLLGGLRAGCCEPVPEDALEQAAAAAGEADAAVVVVGLHADWETEGRDRASLGLPGRQDELVQAVRAANPRTVVVLNAGSPLAAPWMDRVPALLAMWYAGQEAGHALADVLFGDADPGGRLPQTWPRRLEDNPTHLTYPGERGRTVYGEGLFMGYRYYEKKRLAPRFAFGHGLSYTRFAYGPLRARAEGSGAALAVEAELEVTNEGPRPGREVVQLYVRDEAASVLRPGQELRAFEKLRLEPGETRTVRFRLGHRDFAFWDPAAGDWTLEPGVFELRAGSASDRLHTRARLEVA